MKPFLMMLIRIWDDGAYTFYPTKDFDTEKECVMQLDNPKGGYRANDINIVYETHICIPIKTWDGFVRKMNK